MIRTERLTKSYGTKAALVDLDLSVEPGEILGFLGPNGAGKSTTVKILTGLIPADRGRAIVAGYDIASHPLEAKGRTGYVPETPKLYDSLTADAFLDAGRRHGRHRLRRPAGARAPESDAAAFRAVGSRARRLCADDDDAAGDVRRQLVLFAFRFVLYPDPSRIALGAIALAALIAGLEALTRLRLARGATSAWIT